MYNDDNWNLGDADDIAKFVSYAPTIDETLKTSTDSTKLEWRQLPFYENGALIRITDPTWEQKNLSIYFFRIDNTIHRLNGFIDVIKQINSEAGISLTEENVIDYLHFFGFFAWGPEGPFLVIEDADDPMVTVDEKSRNVLRQTVLPAECMGVNEQGKFLCTAAVLYSDALFLCSFEIASDGTVDMTQEDPIAADLVAANASSDSV